MTLSEQLQELIDEHRRKTDVEMMLLEHLDSQLLQADTHIERQLSNILSAHQERRADAIGKLLDIHAVMTGTSWAQAVPPPVDQRYAPPPVDSRARSLAGSIMDQVEQAMGGVH